MANSAAEARPTIELRRRLPLLWLLLLLVAALLLPNRVWNMLLLGLGVPFLIAYIWARQLAKELRASRRLRFGWVAVGDRLSEHFEIRNNSWLPALWVEVVDESNVPGYQVAVVRSLSPDSSDHWRQSAICQQRGQFHLGPWALRAGDPFGIFRVTIPYPTVTEIVIHPPIHSQIPVPLPAGQSHGRAKAREPHWSATVNAAAVRDYQHSDPVHWIHWPSTARRGELLVRQFDLDAAGDIWLVLDLHSPVQLGTGPDGTEEHAVLLAAALAAQGLRQNRAVGLASYGAEPQIIPPGRGQSQEWRLLRALALIAADGASDLSVALQDVGRQVRRGSAAVIITPSAQPKWLPAILHLERRGIRCHTILLDRATFASPKDEGSTEVGSTEVRPIDGASTEAELASEGPMNEGEANSKVLSTILRQLGLNSYLVGQGEVGQRVDDRDRHGFWEFKVTGTGKVVMVRSPFEDQARESPGLRP